MLIVVCRKESRDRLRSSRRHGNIFYVETISYRELHIVFTRFLDSTEDKEQNPRTTRSFVDGSRDKTEKRRIRLFSAVSREPSTKRSTQTESLDKTTFNTKRRLLFLCLC